MQFESLLATDQPPDLGPGPRAGVQSETALTAELTSFFQQHKMPQPKQVLLKALILLWHDHLDAAHKLAQDIDNPDGAFLHGIMHRREPDFSNAAYWFRRVGRHAAFPDLAKRSSKLLASRGALHLDRALLPQQQWEPFAFISACERVIGKPASDSERQVVRELQRLESQTLLDYFMKEGGA